MGCLFSLFRHGTLTPPRKGQLTDKLLEGDVSEEPLEKKNIAADSSQPNGDSAGGQQLQNGTSDEALDDDKALLLGALGATAAGAVTVGAVAGALKTAQARADAQDEREPTPREEEPEVIPAVAQEQDTAPAAVPEESEAPAGVQDDAEPPKSATASRVESPEIPQTAASPVEGAEPTGDDSAAAAAAAIIGTGGVAAAAALTGVALQSEDDAVGDGDPPQSSGADVEEQQADEGDEGEEPAETEGGAEEEPLTQQVEADNEGDADVATETANTPVPSEPVNLDTPNISYQPASPAERVESPAVVTDVDDETGGQEAEQDTTAASDRAEDEPSTHAASPINTPVVESLEEEVEPQIESPRAESAAPSTDDRNDVLSEAVVEVAGDQSELDKHVQETETPVTATEEEPVHSEPAEEAARPSSQDIENKSEPAAAVEEVENRAETPSEWELLIQPTDKGEQSNKEPAVESNSPAPSTAPVADNTDGQDPGTGTEDNHSTKSGQDGDSQIQASAPDSPVPSPPGNTDEQKAESEDAQPGSGYDREEVDTPKIVPTKRLSQQTTPEYEKFMSILVSPKGERQASVSQAEAEDLGDQVDDVKGEASSEIANDSKQEEPSGTAEKQDGDVESRAESSADAVCGSVTDLQEKINSVQSPVPSVKEEPIFKVDRFSAGSDAGLTATDSRRDSNPDATASPVSVAQDDKPIDDSQLDVAASASPQLESPQEAEAGTSGISESRDERSGAASPENQLEPDMEPDASPSKDEAEPVPQSELDVPEDADLRGSAASTEMDIQQDVSEKTEYYDFDPLAQTQSFVFPDELAGRSSQLSEKPSSPFPEIDDNDAGDEASKVTDEANMATTEDVFESKEGELTEVLIPPSTEAETIESKQEDNSPEKIELAPEDEALSNDGEKNAAEIAVDTAPSSEEAGKADAEETVHESLTSPAVPQVSVPEETDGAQDNPKTVKDPTPDPEQAATKIQAGVRGWQTRRKISRQQQAATQIQAGFRGWRVRRGRHMRRTSSLPALSQDAPATPTGQYMDVDILKDRAAAKIQAGFRGWRTRQGMKSLAATSTLDEAPRVSPAISMSEISAEEQAAVRIQAGYRGWRTRRTLKRSLSDPNSEALVLAESQQQARVDDTGAGASGPLTASADERLTSPVEVVTPREEDETAHSIQSIQSEVVSSGGSPRKEDDALVTTSPAPNVEHGDVASNADPSATDTSTVEPAAASAAGGDPSEALHSAAGTSTGPALSDDESQQALAATKIQAGYRGWKTRQQMRAEPADDDDDDETPAVRPTVSAKSVTDSGALPIDFAIVHRPEDDWLTQDLMKIEAEKRAAGGEDAAGHKTDEKLVASTSDEPDGKEGKDARPDSASTTGSSSSWLVHAQTEIRASFQGLRDNVSDALKTVEDTARLVQEKGAAEEEDGATGGAVLVTEGARNVTESGTAPAEDAAEGSSSRAEDTPTSLKPGGEEGLKGNSGDVSQKSPTEKEEEEIWEEIQRSMRYED